MLLFGAELLDTFARYPISGRRGLFRKRADDFFSTKSTSFRVSMKPSPDASSPLPRGFKLNQCQNSARRMIIGIGTPSSQSRIPLPMMCSL